MGDVRESCDKSFFESKEWLVPDERKQGKEKKRLGRGPEVYEMMSEDISWGEQAIFGKKPTARRKGTVANVSPPTFWERLKHYFREWIR